MCWDAPQGDYVRKGHVRKKSQHRQETLTNVWRNDTDA